jgi:hypothetical protein
MTSFRILRRTGKTRWGMDPKWHAVPMDDNRFNNRALCGCRPSVQWTYQQGTAVTCPRCARLFNAYWDADELELPIKVD